MNFGNAVASKDVVVADNTHGIAVDDQFGALAADKLDAVGCWLLQLLFSSP